MQVHVLDTSGLSCASSNANVIARAVLGDRSCGRGETPRKWRHSGNLAINFGAA